jgi:hypothetical protein
MPQMKGMGRGLMVYEGGPAFSGVRNSAWGSTNLEVEVEGDRGRC